MFSLISKKKLTKIAIEIYNNNDTSKADNEKSLYYYMGNANALNTLCSRIGIDLTQIIADMRGDTEC